MSARYDQLHAELEAHSGLRKAALLLHGLAPTDRSWLMERLPPQQSERLQRLLAEVARLGIPADRELVESFAVAGQGDRSALQSAEAFVACAPSSAVKKCLAQEPGAFVDRILSLRNWPWTEEFMATSGHVRKGGHRDGSRGVFTPPKLRQALISEFAKALSKELSTDHSHAIAVSASPSGARRMFGRGGK